MIFVGSPGVGVDHATDLHLPADHVWASTAEHDPIQEATVAWVNPSVPFGDLIFGTDPNSAKFGGHHFHSDPGDPNGDIAHGQYWDRGSSSLKNIGYIVAGQPSKVTP